MSQFLSAPESLWGLFLISLLAASILPLGSEWLLAGMVAAGQPLTGSLLVATLGNTLGACSSYALGLWGANWAMRKLFRFDPEQQQQAERLYRRYGPWALLLSWLPVVGDPLCLVAGITRLPFASFLGPVALGKFSRYLVVALAAGIFRS